MPLAGKASTTRPSASVIFIQLVWKPFGTIFEGYPISRNFPTKIYPSFVSITCSTVIADCDRAVVEDPTSTTGRTVISGGAGTKCRDSSQLSGNTPNDVPSMQDIVSLASFTSDGIAA